MRCAHCKAETHPSTAYVETVGFAKPRKSGGVNALFGKRNTGRVLCQACGQRLLGGFLRAENVGHEESTQERML